MKNYDEQVEKYNDICNNYCSDIRRAIVLLKEKGERVCKDDYKELMYMVLKDIIREI